MKLGILVTTDRHLADVLGIVDAALEKGHEVIIFNMDEGARLLADGAFHSLCERDNVRMSYCDLNARQLNIAKEGIPGEIACGSQLDNARMVHDADRVIRL
ncbi:MAG: hypothetical protein P8Y85_06465 [Nitrospirota bacterium]|jgi:hypothetical protein